MRSFIGSAKSGVAGVYNKAVYLDEQRQSLDQWAAYLTGQVARTDLAPIGTGSSAPLSAGKSSNPETSEEIRGKSAPRDEVA